MFYILYSKTIYASFRIKFTGIYLEAPDHYGHKFGVNSLNLTTVLHDIDNSLGEFRRNLTSLGLHDDVNIMIFSDHGMTNITKMVNITEAIELNDIKVIFSPVPYVSIWPMDGKLDKVSYFLCYLQNMATL